MDHYNRTPSLFENTWLDEFCWVLFGMGLGMYWELSPLFFWVSVLSVIAIVCLKINRWVTFREKREGIANSKRF